MLSLVISSIVELTFFTLKRVSHYRGAKSSLFIVGNSIWLLCCKFCYCLVSNLGCILSINDWHFHFFGLLWRVWWTVTSMVVINFLFLTSLCCLWFTEPVGYGDPLIAVLPSFHDIKWANLFCWWFNYAPFVLMEAIVILVNVFQ